MKLSDEILELVPVEMVKNPAYTERCETNWRTMLACYDSEQAALDAVRLNPAVILPYGFDAWNRAQNIAGSYKVLQELLDSEAEVQQIIRQNPGVLGCVPKQLANATASNIRLAAGFASAADTVLGPAKRFLSALPGWDESSVVREDEEEELALPEMNVDGKSYLYDAAGDFMGIEHLVLTLDGVPFGTFDPETDEVEECEFEFEE